MAGKEKNYLDIIRFDKRIKDSLAGRYLTNIRLVILVLIVVLIGGLASFNSLPRRLNPEVKIPIVIVSTVLPGASPSDVENLITIPLENELNTIPDLNTLTSSSAENSSIITLEFLSSVNVDDAVDETQKAVNNVTDLPEDASSPRVQDIDFEDQTIYIFSIKSRSDEASLMNFSERLKENIEALSTIEKVETNGLLENEIRIEIEPEVLAQYKLSLLQISQAIKTALATYPVGSIKTDNNIFSVSIDLQIVSINDLRNLEIRSENSSLKLSEIANVYESPLPNEKSAYISETAVPERVVTFSVFKTSSADITKAVNDTKESINNTLDEQNGNYEVIEIVNYADLINDQFNELSGNFAVTIILVFIVLLAFLGLRQAILASFTIPLSILISFIVMQASGISINFLSLFSLLLALGLLVDNAIVILSAITNYHKSRFNAEESGLLVYKDFLAPIWSTTLTTVWAFLPLLLATGIIGEFIKTIPIVVSTTLISSTLISFFITIPIMIFVLNPSIPKRVILLFYVLAGFALIALGLTIIPQGILFIPSFVLYILAGVIIFKLRNKLKSKNFLQKRDRYSFKFLKETADKGLVSLEIVASKYRRVLRNVINSKTARRKTIISVVIFSIFSYLLLPLGLIKNEFFPASPADEIYVIVDFQPGVSQDVLQKEALSLATTIQEHPDIELISVQYAGSSNDSFSVSGDISLTIKLVEENLRSKNSIELAQEIRDAFSNYEKGELSVVEQSGGPPVGSDIVVTILGEDLEELNRQADSVITFMNNEPSISNAKKSIQPGTGKLSFEPNQQKMNTYGISNDNLGFTLRSYLSGIESDDIVVDGKTLPINLRVNNSDNPNYLNSILVSSDFGPIPLGELGTFSLKENPSQINREDQKRSITLTADVLSGFNIPEENQKVISFIENMNLPQGYTLKTGGVNEENQNSINSILQAMLLSAILILITIVVQLGSFRKALIVMLVIPLAVSGVFVLFSLFGIPLSFPALIGLLALFGIVVNNSIVMIDSINKNLKNGIEFSKSIVDGAASRLEPIFLTSLTTVIGLIPITLSDPLWQGLGGAIIAGLIFSGLIMLFFIPVTYYLIYAGDYKKSKKSA